eukprot:gene14868-18159_t
MALPMPIGLRSQGRRDCAPVAETLMIDSTFLRRDTRSLTTPLVRWQALPCMVATSMVYAALYALSNRLTSLRTDVGAGVFDWERAIPFVSWSVVPYLSICAFFVLSFFIDRDPERLRCHVLRLLVVLL